MAKRKLTHQQTRRIAHQQAQRRQRAHERDTSAEQPGLVITCYGKQADVEAPDGQLLRCHLRTNLSDIVTGDLVVWQDSGDGTGVIVSVEPSRNRLQRPDSYGKLKAIAANIDQVLITIAPEPEPHNGLIDRYLVVAEHLAIAPQLLLNKADLLPPGNEGSLRRQLQCYQQLGYPVYEVSTHTGTGFAELQQRLKGKTTIFAGQSGVGKSSIIQALLPHETIKIGRLSDQIAKGKHTTTHSRLYHFPEGGDCIDSPGIREFGLWHLSAEDVIHGFVELRNLSGHCKFRDCSHTHEPGCALHNALTNGVISEERFESFRRIIQSLDEVEINTR